MNLNDLKEVFEWLDLGQREHAIYCALVGKGPAPANTLALRAKLKRPNAYAALETLERHGLVYSAQKTARSKFYYAGAAGILLALVEDKKKAAEELANKTQDLVNELTKMRIGENVSPAVTAHLGIDGLKQAYLALLESAANQKSLVAIVPEQFEKSPMATIGDWFIEQRKRRGIKLLCLEPLSTLEEVRKKDHVDLRETYPAPEGLTSENCLIEVSESVITLAYFLETELYTIVIRHTDLSRLIYGLVSHIWHSQHEIVGRSESP